MQFLGFEIGKACISATSFCELRLCRNVTRLATPLAKGAAGPSQLMQSRAKNKEKLPPEVRIAVDCRPDTSCVIEGGAVPDTAVKQKNLLIKGIAFYPEISGTRLIFMFNNEIKTNQNIDNKSIDKKERENQNDNIMRNLDERDGLKNKKIKVRYVCKSSNPVFATFQLKKTADIDVYKLYLVESSKQNEKNVWKSKRMGIALIPTKECSILCKNIFNKNNNKVFMKCKFISEKNKWQPIEEDLKSTMPTNIDEIEAQLNIIEEETDDEDE
jgi:hypothetical protein